LQKGRRDQSRHRGFTKLATWGALWLLLAACGRQPDISSTGPKLRIVTTVAPITSIVSSVVGGLAEVTGVVPEGINSHTFEPSPRVAELLSAADLIFLNGLGLERPIKRLAEQHLSDGAEIVELGNRAIAPSEYIYDSSFPLEGGNPNPHLWTDPTLVRRYAQVVRDELVDRDPDHADSYTLNYQALATRIDDLDGAMRTSFATVPPSNRKLLTYHDAYAYFARTYGWTVIGAIQVSDFKDPTPREVAGLIDQVRKEGVPAIFGSEVFPSPVLEQIGREAGVRYVDVLRDDDLPETPGEANHSWLGLMRFNYITMVESLGGDASPLKALEVEDGLMDRAEYPQ
jgi:ABC-type Zn uptake system ZnuABC Zn-binding protein ZnuA